MMHSINDHLNDIQTTGKCQYSDKNFFMLAAPRQAKLQNSKLTGFSI